MANQYRGEVPFRALGRELFLVYGNQELADIQSSLGFVRPSALEPPREEEIPEERLVPVLSQDLDAAPVLDDDGRPKMRTEITRRPVVVDFEERLRRVHQAFGHTLDNPLFADLLVMIRHGLRRYERKAGTLKPEDWEALQDELGLEGLRALHTRGLIGAFQEPRLGGSADPNAPGAGPVPTTSTTS